MNKTRKHLTFIVLALAIAAGCCAILWNLPKINASPGIPQGNCSVEALLLDLNAFPPGTEMSSGQDFEDLALDTASKTFFNLSPSVHAYHAVEYYNTPFLAWQVYTYQSGVFKKTEYRDRWRQPTDLTFFSKAADQYRFECTDDRIVGSLCVMHARYGRYFVLLSASVSQEFGVRDLEILLENIDSRIASCKDH